MFESKKSLFSVLIVAALVIIMGGVSYAYFTFGLSGQETVSTVVVTGGRMTITYQNNSSNVLIENIYPRAEAWATKDFTVNGTNTTDLLMRYQLYLQVDNNTFAANALTCTLSSSTTDENSTLVAITDANALGIPVSGNLYLGEGSFNGADGVDHNYRLQIFFKDSNANQNTQQTQRFAGHVVVGNDEE